MRLLTAIEGGAAAADALLARPGLDPPGALFLANNLMTIGALGVRDASGAPAWARLAIGRM